MESLLLVSEANSQLFFGDSAVWTVVSQQWSRWQQYLATPLQDAIFNQEPNHLQRGKNNNNIDISHKPLFTADNFIVIHASPAITEAVESCEMYSECVARRSLTCQRNAAVFEKDHSPETDLIDSRILAVLWELSSGHGKPSIASIRVNERSSYAPNCK